MSAPKLLNLILTRVDGPVFDGEVLQIQVPGLGGEMTILANHTSLISPLKMGIITITKPDNTTEMFAIEKGTIEISANHATVLI